MTQTYTSRASNKHPSALGNFQTVFRVAGTSARQKRPSLPLVSLPTTAPRQRQRQPEEVDDTAHRDTTSRTRRSHRKSRAGCQNCKARRVKCDERRDEQGCLKCRLHGIDCDYVVAISTSDGGSVPDLRQAAVVYRGRKDSGAVDIPYTSPSWTAAGVPQATTTVATLCSSVRPRTPFRHDLPPDITPCLQIFHHFERFTCPTITSPDGIDIMRTSVLAIAEQRDYLMHAMLGTAAAHLAWHTDRWSSFTALRQHQQAEAYHWHHAIRIFRERLLSLNERGEETDALISTCMLLAVHSHTLSIGSNATSFVWAAESERAHALHWLTVQTGFGTMLRALGNRMATSVWLEVVNSAASREAEFAQGADRTTDIYGDFLAICMIDERSACRNSPYLLAIQDLFALWKMGPPTMATFAPLMAFMGRLTGPFRQLLVKLDPAALLVVAYWLALMQKLQLWWIHERATLEITAIVTFLKHDTDGRVQRLLRFPAGVAMIGLD